MKKNYLKPEMQCQAVALTSIVCQSGTDSVRRVSGNAELDYGGSGHSAARAPQFKGVMDE